MIYQPEFSYDLFCKKAILPQIFEYFPLTFRQKFDEI